VVRKTLREKTSVIKARHDKVYRNEQFNQAIRVHKYTMRKVANLLEIRFSAVSAVATRLAERKPRRKTLRYAFALAVAASDLQDTPGPIP